MVKEYKVDDAESQAAHQQYKTMIESIHRTFNPQSNTVLIVDDEKAIRKKVARDVHACAPEVVIFEAGNGKEALERLARIRADYARDPLLIVLDLHMPIMDGWEVIEALKTEYESQGRAAGIPIVVLSSTSGEKQRSFFRKQSIHGGKAGYVPLVSVAKENCVSQAAYDAAGDKGLFAWLDHFTQA